jgi:hypothetical protein
MAGALLFDRQVTLKASLNHRAATACSCFKVEETVSLFQTHNSTRGVVNFCSRVFFSKYLEETGAGSGTRNRNCKIYRYELKKVVETVSVFKTH